MTTNYKAGHDAELVAVDYLVNQGYAILDKNWRTRYCEIDIVARKNDVAYLIEVKSRRTMLHGSGLEYITGRKLRQMQFAAELWVSAHNWRGQYQLSALAIDAGHIEFVDRIDL